MKASAVVDLARNDLDDVAEPYLWTTPHLLGLVAEAQQEACMRADLLWDATSTFCTLAVAAAAVSVPLDSRISRIEWAGWDNGTTVTPIGAMDEREAERNTPTWRSHTGNPSAFIQKPNALRLYPAPAAAGTLRLEVFREPLLTTLASTSTLEVPARYGHMLLDWVLHRAFMTRDSDKRARELSADALARFTANFGPRPNVAAQVSRQQRRDNTVRPTGF